MLNTHLIISTSNDLLRVAASHILYIMSDGNYCNFFMAGGVLLDIMRFLVLRIPHFTLVNILAKRELIVELLARHFTVDSLANELNRLLGDEAYVAQMREGYAAIKQQLGTKPAAETAADIIIKNK